jgi:hypothetical protein
MELGESDSKLWASEESQVGSVLGIQYVNFSNNVENKGEDRSEKLKIKFNRNHFHYSLGKL